MTIKEAIISSVSGLADDSLVDKVIIDRAVSGAVDYIGSEEQFKQVELCKADIYMVLVTSPDLSDGKVSFTFKRQTMLSTAKSIYKKYSDSRLNDIQGPTIEDKTNQW